MTRSLPLLLIAIAGLLCLSACGSDGSESSDAHARNESATSSATEPSTAKLTEIFDQLPISVEPSVVLSEDNPPRLVVRTGVAFQTMDFINGELAEAFVTMGFSRSSDDDSVWTNEAGVRIDVGSRPTLLEIDFTG